MKKNHTIVACFMLLFSFMIISCQEKYTPKPRGYYRITFPEKEYKKFSGNNAYHFMQPEYMSVKEGDIDGDHWYTFFSKEHKAEIHLSYKPIDNNLPIYLEDSREMVYKHAIKATSIEEELYKNKEDKVYGVIYKLEGNTASPLQFVVTDSVRNFLRGALYFREVPNADSIQPSIDFFSEDVIKLIQTTKWNSNADY